MDQTYNITSWQTLFTWLRRWLLYRLSKRQSPTTVLLRTTLTWTITLTRTKNLLLWDSFRLWFQPNRALFWDLSFGLTSTSQTKCNWWTGIVFVPRSNFLGVNHMEEWAPSLHTKIRLFSPCWGLLFPMLAVLSVLDGLYLILTTKQRRPSLFFLQHGFENPCWTKR